MTSDLPHQLAATRHLFRPEGRVGYDVAGDGALVVLIPGMGDLRATYRFLAPTLRDAEYRVACTDLRGHGDSDTTFSSYGDEETASDVLALIDELGGPAIIIGNSMGAGAAVIAAVTRPDRISSLILVGPFVRNSTMSTLQRLLMRVALATPFVATTWKAYMPKLYAGARPADFSIYRSQVIASIRRPGYAKALALSTRTNHDPTEARLSGVSAPTLVIMGEQDPDFPDPRAEAEWVAHALRGEVVMVSDAGHYPQSQVPDVVSSAIVEFLQRVSPNA
jgi:pimeloyl-ACP methyl ester carboxylesterase